MAAPELKICGLTRREDADLCHELGVAYTGFIFAAESPRAVSPEAVAGIPAGRAKRVGVFTRASLDEIRQTMKTASLDYIQLHGGQDVAFCRALAPERVIKVFWPEKQDMKELQTELRRFAGAAAFFLFDAGTGGGGAGRSFAMDLLDALEIPCPWFLAGGVGPETAVRRDAASGHSGGKARIYRLPYALDVNSGVESAPGIKDAAMLRALVNNMQRNNKKE